MRSGKEASRGKEALGRRLAGVRSGKEASRVIQD